MAKKLKLLIVGGSGFVGTSLTKMFVDQFQVFSSYHHSYTPIKGAHYLPIPTLSEKDQCNRFIYSIEPDVLIYCLGSNDEAEAEKETKKAQHIHSGGITHLLHATEVIKAKFIYISSDFVFSGSGGNFSEHDTALPFVQLGKAKSGAENYLKSCSLNHLIIRSAPLLGRGTLDHPSWLDQVRDKIIHNKKVQMSSKNVHNPVHISFLAEVIVKAIEKDLRNEFLHVGGLTKISAYELTKRFLVEIGLPPHFVEMSDGDSAGSLNDYSLNFSETLNLIEAKPLFLEQSFDLLK